MSVGILHQVYQTGSDQMRQMADGSHDPVMLVIVQNDGNGTDELCHGHNPVCVCFRREGSGCYNIIGIF